MGLKPSQNLQYLISEPNEAQVFNVSSQKEFSERQRVDKKWIYSDTEKHTPQTECGPSQRVSAAAAKCGMFSIFNRLDNFIC